MIATVQFADVGPRRVLSLLRRRPRPGAVAGLRQIDVGVAAPFGPRPVRAPDFGRVAVFAFWDDDAAADAYFAKHPFAAALGGGWSVRLEPLRSHGSWQGLPAELSHRRILDLDGPFAVVTLGRLRPSQSVRFFRTNAKAERGVREAPGNIWATAAALPPFVATCSLWESEGAINDYAYRAGAGHATAIPEQMRKSFHRESAFIRFRPYASEGGLGGRNPLPASWM